MHDEAPRRSAMCSDVRSPGSTNRNNIRSNFGIGRRRGSCHDDLSRSAASSNATPAVPSASSDADSSTHRLYRLHSRMQTPDLGTCNIRTGGCRLLNSPVVLSDLTTRTRRIASIQSGRLPRSLDGPARALGLATRRLYHLCRQACNNPGITRRWTDVQRRHRNHIVASRVS